MKNPVLLIHAGISLLALGITPVEAFTSIKVQSVFSQGTGTSADTVSTSIFVQNLGDHTAPSLGAFDFNFQFDENILRLDRVVFSPLLGDPDNQTFNNSSGILIPDAHGGDQALTGADLSAGNLRVFAISLLEADQNTCIFCIPPYLDDIQPSNFVVLGLGFTGLVDIPNANRDRLGFNLTDINLSDAFGNPLIVDEDDITYFPVPVPSSVALFGIGLLGLNWTKTRQKSRSSSAVSG